MKNFKLFKKLLVLAIVLITCSPQMWAVNSAFTPGEILYVNGYSSGNAWGSSACVKAEFSKNGSNAKEVDTHWMFDKDGGKLFYIIVPADRSDYSKLRLHRYASNCSTNWNFNGDIQQSNRSSDAYNMLCSNGTGNANSDWKSPRETYKFDLYGSTNGWASAIGTMEHVGNGKFFYGFTFTAAATSYNFKLCDSWSIWWGASSDGNNVTLSGLTVGKEYYIYATMDLATSLNYNNGSNPRSSLQVKALEVHEPGVYESASGYNKSLKTYSGYDYEIYRYSKNSSNWYIFAGESLTTNTSDKHCLLEIPASSDYAAKTLGWILHRGGVSGNTSSASSTAGEFSAVGSSQAMKCYQNPGTYGQGYTLFVKGYDKFHLWAQDKDVSKSYIIKVYVNGSDVTDNSVASLTIREYALDPSETSLIQIQCLGPSSSNTDILYGFSLRIPGAECTATQPGALSKGTLSGCSRTITALGSPASNNKWYWQSSSTGTDKSDEYSSGKAITAAGTYYLRSYCSNGVGCWSDAVSVEITAADMTPSAPTALTKSSITAKGVTLAVTDAANTNDYDFYVSTSSSAPDGSTPATYTSTSKTLTITNLYAGTTFYAWARAKCGSNKSAWTALTGSNFTTSTVTVTHTLTNVTETSSAATSGVGGSDYTAVYAADEDYSLPTPVVTIGGNTATSGTDYSWASATGTITVYANKINGNIAITLNSADAAPSSATISGAYHYFPGENISLTCTPSGNNGPTTYQWYKGGKENGNAIAGATSATYTKNSCTFDDAGSYYCKVTCNATSIWAVTNSHENYDVKILRLYVKGSKNGEDDGNVDFVKVNSTTARASISLGSNWTYGFNIADGCGHYYGNAGTMTENNCGPWVTDMNGTDCGLTTTNAATYIFTINYSNLSRIETSVTFPVANQAAGKVIYFDNNVLKWTGSSIYYRIGHSSHSQADQLSLVPGTANLYKMTTREYNNFSAWQIGNAEGGNGSEKSIYNTKNTPAITASVAYEGGAVTDDAVTVTPGSDHSTGGSSDNNNCEFYSKTITSGMKTDRVTISDYSHGTITVNYVNTSNVASSFTSGYADLAHTVILTSITAVADAGYDASAITINGGAYSANYVVTGATTIAASFTIQTYSVTHTLSGGVSASTGATGAGAATYGTAYNATFAAAAGYALPSTITVTAGGSPLTAGTGYTWNSATGALTVNAAYVTGAIVVTIAGDDIACFRMAANSAAASEQTLAAGESITAGSKNCLTLTGGTARNGNANSMKVQKDATNWGWYFGSNTDTIVIDLSDSKLQVGSVIHVEGVCGGTGNVMEANGVVIATLSGSAGAYSNSYTVTAGNTDLVGKHVIKLRRGTGSATRLYSITISNCADRPTFNVTYYPNGGSGSSTTHIVSEVEGISDLSFTRAGYNFTGWKTGASSGTDYAVGDEITEEITLYAQWSCVTPSFGTNLSTSQVDYEQGASASALTVAATATGTGGNGTVSYQWYSNTTNSTAGATTLAGKTSTSYTPSTASLGTMYYYCVATNSSSGCSTTATSNIAKIVVSEAPCFKITDAGKNGSSWPKSNGNTIANSDIDGTITGGSVTYSGSGSLTGNDTHGIIFDNDNDELTITLSGSHALAAGSVITIVQHGNSSTSKATGFKVSGNSMSPATCNNGSTSYKEMTQTYTVVAADGIAGTKSFTIKWTGTNQVYLKSITVTGCVECTPITPSLSYSKTTLWVNDGDTSTPTLDKDESTGSVTYSSSNTDVATVNESTGVVTAVAGGNVTITASIAADGTHCANTATCNLTIKQATCGEVVIAGVTLSAKDAGTPEGTLIASSSGYVVSTQKWEEPKGGCGTGGKLGESGNYICLTLKSGESFKNGDKVILDIATVPDIGDGKLHIYSGTSSAGTQLGVNASPVCGENEIILSGISSSTPSITLYRTGGDDKQNPYVVSMKVKRFICTDCLGFVDATENGNWNTAGNWIGSTGVSASVPTISDRVHIYKPVTVDINNAKASSVYIYTNSTNTGKVTIDAGNALIIAGTLKKTTTGTSVVATAAADVIINSTRAAGTGALVMGSHDGTNAATVNFETKVKRESGTGNWINQFIGSPFSDLEPYVDYALQIYEFRPADDGNRGFWHKLSSGDGMEAFWGYNVLYNDNDYLDVQWTGTLNASSNNVTKTGSYEVQTDNLFANSWVAPIHIAAFEEGDFTNLDPTIYIFNAGTPQQEDAAGGIGSGTASASSAGTYAVLPIDAAPWVGMEVIPAMQAFFVKATGASPSIKLDYSKLVYTPALTSVDITPTRAPRRSAEVAPEVIRLHVAGENGWAENTYVLGREDFTEGYDRGWDGRYMEGEDTNPQLYTPTTDGYMAVNCVPEIEGTVVGFRKGSSDNNYIFSFDYDGDEVWYLNDQKAQKSTQIMNGQTYAFVSEAGDNAARFVISATPINKIATGCESVGAEAAMVRKVIIDDKVYIIRGGQVFDVLGKTIKK